MCYFGGELRSTRIAWPRKTCGRDGARRYKIPGRELAVAATFGGGLVYTQNPFGPTRRRLGSAMWQRCEIVRNAICLARRGTPEYEYRTAPKDTGRDGARRCKTPAIN